MKNCPTKIIIRRLPPKLTEEEFLKIVAPLPPYSYFRFCAPDDSLGGLSLPRAYITFNDIESLFDFKERFDNYVFVDSEGNESYALAEFAVCQTLANIKETSATKKAEKVDKKQGTLHEDPEFIAFVNSLRDADAGSKPSDGEPKKTCWEAILEEIQARESASEKTQEPTPLVAFLQQRELENRRKEEEYGRHGKPFKSHNVSSARKASRAEKASRGAPVAARRPKEPKRNSVSSYPNREISHHAKSEDDGSGAGAGGKSQRGGEATGTKPNSQSNTLDANEFPTMQGSQPRPVKQSVGSRSDRPSAWATNITGGSSKDRSKPESQSSDSAVTGTKSHSSSPHTSKPPTPVISEPAIDSNGIDSDSKVPTTIKDSKKSAPNHRVPIETQSPSTSTTTTPSVDAGSSDYCTSSPLPIRGDSTGYRSRRASGYYGSRSSASFSTPSRRPGKSQRGRRDSDSSLHGSSTDHVDSTRDASVERGSLHARPQSVRGRRGGTSGGSGSAAGPTRGTHGNDADPGYTRSSHRSGHQNHRSNVGSSADDYTDDSYRSSYGDLYGSSSSRYGTGGRGGAAGGGGSSRSRASTGTSASSNSSGRRRASGYNSRGGGWSEG